MCTQDVSLGFLSIENFEVYSGGIGSKVRDSTELLGWMKDVGAVVGESMYAAAEAAAIRRIDAYVLSWRSTQDGLVNEIMRACASVLQGNRMLEVWATSQEQKITSLAYCYPQALGSGGRKLIIDHILIKKRDLKSDYDEGDGEPALAEGNAADKATKGDLAEDLEDSKEAFEETDGTLFSLPNSPAAHQHTEKSITAAALILGISYNGFEQLLELQVLCSLNTNTMPTSLPLHQPLFVFLSHSTVSCHLVKLLSTTHQNSECARF
jgi:hypothetical protein